MPCLMEDASFDDLTLVVVLCQRQVPLFSIGKLDFNNCELEGGIPTIVRDFIASLGGKYAFIGLQLLDYVFELFLQLEAVIGLLDTA